MSNPYNKIDEEPGHWLLEKSEGNRILVSDDRTFDDGVRFMTTTMYIGGSRQQTSTSLRLDADQALAMGLWLVKTFGKADSDEGDRK